ncbi:MAG TPA: TetR/AcrR family transcriptional regulator [Kofleriaceae bacterium]|nr:TetR/AcrR family transcriptional regulator [Kofleriaceae bacterium]
MGLLEEHKAERRERIRAAARRLVAARGYEGLTMRDLARAARVSVPTLYNLFGSKDAILTAELESSVLRVAAELPSGGESFFARGMAAFEAGMRVITDAPEFYRQLMRLFLTSPEARAIRRRTEEGYIAIMTSNLSAAKAAGQLAEFADPATVARHMFALYMAHFLAWGMDELDLEGFRLTALSGICHLLLGVARGPFAEEVQARLRQVRPPARTAVQDRVESSDATSSRPPSRD